LNELFYRQNYVSAKWPASRFLPETQRFLALVGGYELQIDMITSGRKKR
jgi:hypothetical protein